MLEERSDSLDEWENSPKNQFRPKFLQEDETSRKDILSQSERGWYNASLRANMLSREHEARIQYASEVSSTNGDREDLSIKSSS